MIDIQSRTSPINGYKSIYIASPESVAPSTWHYATACLELGPAEVLSTMRWQR